jgi:hypothetical protein
MSVWYERQYEYCNWNTGGSMSPTLLYRISAALLLLFAVGHTVGFLTFEPPSPEGIAVRDAMNSVLFDFKGSNYSYGGFYKGFGLTVTAYMLFSAFLAWHLGWLASTSPRSIGALAWIFAAVQLAGLVLSLRYFFLIPSLFSGVLVFALTWAAWLLRGMALNDGRT